MNALSLDLRKRVMEYVDSGHSYREASIHFSINESSVYRWSKLRKATGSLEAVLVPRSPHKLPDIGIIGIHREASRCVFTRDCGSF